MSEQTKTDDLSTKERLLQAGVEVFAAKGFQTATVREICQAAGTNVAAVNYHFGDKERLYAAVLWHVFSAHKSIVDIVEADKAGLTPEERLARIIHAEVTYIYQTKSQKECSGEQFPLFLMEMAHPSPSLAAVVEEFIRPDHDTILSIVREILGPDVPKPVLDRCGDTVWGQILHQLFVWPIGRVLNPDRIPASEDIDDLADHITTVTLGGLTALKARLDKQRKES